MEQGDDSERSAACASSPRGIPRSSRCSMRWPRGPPSAPTWCVPPGARDRVAPCRAGAPGAGVHGCAPAGRPPGPGGAGEHNAPQRCKTGRL